MFIVTRLGAIQLPIIHLVGAIKDDYVFGERFSHIFDGLSFAFGWNENEMQLILKSLLLCVQVRSPVPAGPHGDPPMLIVNACAKVM